MLVFPTPPAPVSTDTGLFKFLLTAFTCCSFKVNGKSKSGKISDSSPIGVALIGNREGDVVTVTGAREQTIRILSVKRAKE